MTHGRPDAVDEQLAWVRRQESRTHANRRRTNWLVTIFCLLTLITTFINRVDTSHEIAQVLRGEHAILHHQHTYSDTTLPNIGALEVQILHDEERICVAMHIPRSACFVTPAKP